MGIDLLGARRLELSEQKVSIRREGDAYLLVNATHVLVARADKPHVLADAAFLAGAFEVAHDYDLTAVVSDSVRRKG